MPKKRIITPDFADENDDLDGERVGCLPLMMLVAVVGILAFMFTSCAGSQKTRTTTTRMGITGAQETTVIETPYVDPFDAALADAMRGVMQP